MMAILAFDTALDKCSVAVGQGGEVLASSTVRAARGHAELLMPMIQDLMAEANIRMEGIDRLAVAVGPGTFAGVRVAVAAANSLALALHCPVVGVTTLEAMAAKALQDEIAGDEGEKLLVLLTVGSANVFCQWFQIEKEQRITSVDAARRIDKADIPGILGSRNIQVIQRSGAEIPELAKGHVRGGMVEPDASTLLFLSQHLNASDLPGRIKPVYLRPPDAKAGSKGFSPASRV